jgi:hypothetical protein
MVLTQETGMTFLDQLPTFHVSRKVHTIPAPKFSATYYVVSEVIRINRHNLKRHYKDT